MKNEKLRYFSEDIDSLNRTYSRVASHSTFNKWSVSQVTEAKEGYEFTVSVKEDEMDERFKNDKFMESLAISEVKMERLTPTNETILTKAKYAIATGADVNSILDHLLGEEDGTDKDDEVPEEKEPEEKKDESGSLQSVSDLTDKDADKEDKDKEIEESKRKTEGRRSELIYTYESSNGFLELWVEKRGTSFSVTFNSRSEQRKPIFIGKDINDIDEQGFQSKVKKIMFNLTEDYDKKVISEMKKLGLTLSE